MNQNPGTSSTPDPILDPTQDHAEGAAAGDGQHPHKFEVQKELHQRIRNDPDYDDWEYGTEPLPHEAWALRQPPRASA